MKTQKTQSIVNGIMWASAILASAILGGPQLLTLVLLPVLGVVSLASACATKKI